MSENDGKPKINESVERLNSDIIDEHLRNSTAALQDILKDKEDFNYDGEQPFDSEDDENQEGQVCQHCGKIYKTASTLQAHYLLMHPKNEIEGQCVACDKKYPSLLSLQKHIRYMHRYGHRCKVCYRTFATPELLVVHGETCSRTEAPCSQCDKVFNSHRALQNHTKYKHPERRNHWCEVCRRAFTTHRGLMNHNAKIHPPGATNCNWCEKTFNSVTALQSHILYKHTANGSKCVQCHKVFLKKIGLQKHLVNNHQYFMADSVNNFESGTSSEPNIIIG